MRIKLGLYATIIISLVLAVHFVIPVYGSELFASDKDSIESNSIENKRIPSALDSYEEALVTDESEAIVSSLDEKSLINSEEELASSELFAEELQDDMGLDSIDDPYFSFVVKRTDEITEKSVTVKNAVVKISLDIGDKLIFSLPSRYGMKVFGSSYFDVEGLTLTAKAPTPSGRYVGFLAYEIFDEDNESARLLVSIVGTPKITTSDFVEYITDGYDMMFKAETVSGSQNITFDVLDAYRDYVSSINSVNNSDKTVTVKIKFSEMLDKGNNTKDIKISATVDGMMANIDSDTDTTKTISIFSKPTASFSTSNRSLTYNVPSKINTGMTSGKDSNNIDTLTMIPEIKGVKIQALTGNTSLGVTSIAKSSGTNETLDPIIMETIAVNLSSKFSGESSIVTFRVYPSDDRAKYNKNIYADVSTTVYRARITYDDPKGELGVVDVYGFEGQKIDVASIERVQSALKGMKLKLLDSNGNAIDSFIMSKYSVKNDHKAIFETTTDNAVYVSSVSLNTSSMTLNAGTSETLIATVLPSNATYNRVSWESDNTFVAMVNSSGKVIAIREGSAKITVTTTDGSNKSAFCTVTVESKNKGMMISAGEAVGITGKMVSVPVRLSGNTGLGGFAITINSDPLLTLLSIEKGNLLTSGTFNADVGTGLAQWYTSSSAIKGDGILFTLKYEIKAESNIGSYPVSINFKDGLKSNITDENGATLDVTLKSGRVSVQNVIKGDVTGDGEVAMGDVVKVARAVSGSVTLNDEEKVAADVTGDGEVAMGDVVKIARLVAGSITEL